MTSLQPPNYDDYMKKVGAQYKILTQKSELMARELQKKKKYNEDLKIKKIQIEKIDDIQKRNSYLNRINTVLENNRIEFRKIRQEYLNNQEIINKVKIRARKYYQYKQGKQSEQPTVNEPRLKRLKTEHTKPNISVPTQVPIQKPTITPPLPQTSSGQNLNMVPPPPQGLNPINNLATASNDTKQPEAPKKKKRGRKPKPKPADDGKPKKKRKYKKRQSKKKDANTPKDKTPTPTSTKSATPAATTSTTSSTTSQVVTAPVVRKVDMSLYTDIFKATPLDLKSITKYNYLKSLAPPNRIQGSDSQSSIAQAVQARVASYNEKPLSMATDVPDVIERSLSIYLARILEDAKTAKQYRSSSQRSSSISKKDIQMANHLFM